MVQVIDAAADYGKGIEINAHPMRLDLDWRLCRYARDKGVKIYINPDAHNVDGLRDVYTQDCAVRAKDGLKHSTWSMPGPSNGWRLCLSR